MRNGKITQKKGLLTTKSIIFISNGEIADNALSLQTTSSQFSLKKKEKEEKKKVTSEENDTSRA